MEWTGSGPYVVIDNRNKKPSKSQDDQSDEGMYFHDLVTFVKLLISSMYIHVSA